MFDQGNLIPEIFNALHVSYYNFKQVKFSCILLAHFQNANTLSISQNEAKLPIP
jgi:hypothetical protein